MSSRRSTKKRNPVLADTPAPSQGQKGNIELSDRVTRLLIACIDSFGDYLPQDDPLNGKLRGLNTILKKAVGHQPTTALGKEIQDFFSRKKLEEEFRSLAENEEIKPILTALLETLREMICSSNEFAREMTSHVEKLQNLDSEYIVDFFLLRKQIVSDLGLMRVRGESLGKTLDKKRETIARLLARLEQAKSKTFIDPVTQVLNKPACDLRKHQMVREFGRYGDPGSFMLASIDRIKVFIDTYGHETGNRVIRDVAESIQETIRDSDLLFRYGPEQFALILIKISPENAKKVAEKIRARVEYDYFLDKDHKRKVTISLGVANLKSGDTESSLLERAEAAMRESIEKGRNLVTIAD